MGSIRCCLSKGDAVVSLHHHDEATGCPDQIDSHKKFSCLVKYGTNGYLATLAIAAVLPIANTTISAYFTLGRIEMPRRISTGTSAHAASVMTVTVVMAYEMGTSPGV